MSLRVQPLGVVPAHVSGTDGRNDEIGIVGLGEAQNAMAEECRELSCAGKGGEKVVSDARLPQHEQVEPSDHERQSRILFGQAVVGRCDTLRQSFKASRL